MEIPPPGGHHQVASIDIIAAAAATATAADEGAVAVVAADESDLVPQPKLHLTLRGPSLPNVPDVEVELSTDNGEWTVFKAVQKLIQSSTLGNR